MACRHYFMPAGMNLANMSKCLKCAGNDDIITMKVAPHTIQHP